MARKKQQKKRNKKYQQKYTTDKRLDMRNGGRVSYQLGKKVKEPREEEMFIQRKDDTVIPRMPNENPVPFTPPTTTTSEINKAEIPAKLPVGDKPDRFSIEREGNVRPDRSNMIFADNMDTASMRIDDVMDGKGIGNRNRGRGKDDGTTKDNREPRDPPNGQTTITGANGFIYSWDGFRYVNTGQKAGGTTETDTTTETGETPITGTVEQFEEERGKRITQTGRTAEEIAAGKIPEGMIPEQELVPLERGEEYEAETIALAERKGVTPEYIKEVGPEVVQLMEDISTVKTPEPVIASTFNADTVAEQVQINVAKGEMQDKAIAQSLGVDRVAPVEGAEVEIESGALAQRVVGTLSPEAKASAAQVAGTSLARITRAKKQLRTAGLSEEDITELGNDPEELEARLTDFTEAQRGVIAGLPKEALVSNQIDSLLSGMENGEIPAWARPAVASVEAMLAKRGLSASSVGRDNLFNAIIQSAVPIAQSNAQAIQQSVSQQKSIEAQAELQNAQMRQQTALSNADKVFNLNMAQFNADQQTELSNSKFMQTVSLTEASNEQQATIQNAVLMSQANITEAGIEGQRRIQNAKNFLTVDMANLNNQQQANVLQAQQEQQRMLSNQAATNASRQFNSASENQTQQFMSNLNAQMEQFNSQQVNASKQFNAQQSNAAEARRAGRDADLNKANAAIVNQTRQFNEQMDFNRDQFNTQNALAIQQSNVDWRRRANLADTAAQNAINQENVKMSFGMSSAAQSFLWQELRDQADYNFRWANDTATRKVQAMIAAASAEGDVAKNWQSNFNSISGIIDRVIGLGD